MSRIAQPMPVIPPGQARSKAEPVVELAPE